jgi:hypothetical protein
VTQDQWIILAFKIATISGFVALVAWIVVYTRLAAWWKNPVGRTLVAKSALIAALLVPTALSLFFNLNRLDSRIAGWIDVALLGLVTPVMWWRTAVWIKLHRAGQFLPNGQDGRKGGA